MRTAYKRMQVGINNLCKYICCAAQSFQMNWWSPCHYFLCCVIQLPHPASASMTGTFLH